MRSGAKQSVCVWENLSLLNVVLASAIKPRSTHLRNVSLRSRRCLLLF